MPAASHVRVAIDSAAKNFSQTPGRGDFVILPEWQHAKLHELKTANPKLKVLMYKNLSAMMSSTNGDSGTGVTTQEAADHPEWYLLNTANQRFTFGGYGYLYAADIGNPSYQARWLANVKADLQADQWDGVFIDDANPTIKYHYKATDVPQLPERRGLRRRDRLDAGRRRAVAAVELQARDRELRRLAHLPRDRRQAGSRPCPAGWRSTSPSTATPPRPGT